MDQPLDLSITLTKPPQGSPPEAIAHIALRCDGLGLAHTGDLLYDPLTLQERDDLRWYLEEYWKWPYEQFLKRGRRVEDLLADLGERVYEMVFGSVQAKEVGEQWLKQPTTQHQISVVSEMPRVLSLPWELLHDTNGFLALKPNCPVSIVRRLPQSEQSPLSTSFEPPLRVLLVTARPEGTGFIDPRGIARELVDEVQTQVEEGTIELEFLRPPTLSALHTRLRDRERPQVHVFHFDGHGVFNEEKDGQGVLFFETSGGQASPVKASDLAKVLRDSGIRLAVLTACQSAMSATDDAFSSVAAQLIQGGIDAVAAMSASVLVASATRYVEAFYHALAAGTAAPIAQEQARQALHDDPHRHLLRRRRDEEGKPVEMHDWWLPHFYQQRPVSLQPREVRHEHMNIQRTPPLRRLSEETPSEPRYGFSGRTRELFQVERALLRGKLVVISGFGGVGKTALAREAADWLTRTRLYGGACFVSFEHGGDTATLLSALGHFLNIYNAHYTPSDSATALSQLKPALKEHHTLVIADNLESILPGGEALLDTTSCTHLWDVLLELVKMGTGVLLTSRDITFGDERLAPGSRVVHLALKGLHPEDAYFLATRQLNSLGIDRRQAPYVELRDLLTQLDYHPLAIQLVLPALLELPLSKVKADFAMLLPKFVDDQETGRNKSLLASLEYSLQQLSEEQRALLPRLIIFEGGASELGLLKITEIPEAEWTKLRSVLERVALLATEQIHEDVDYPFLHFHPVLIPYLRRQFRASAALGASYLQGYYELAHFLHLEDRRHPQAARALVWRELPNLRRALKLLLEAEEWDRASSMANRIAEFLTIFGQMREHDELRRQMAKAAAAMSTQEGQNLTLSEWLYESGIGRDERTKGNLPEAFAHLTALLTRIEVLPKGTPLGPGSYEHCLTLHELALCFENAGQPAIAEDKLNEALSIIDALIRREPDQTFIRQRGIFLSELGSVQSTQGKYSQAQHTYQEALTVFTLLKDLSEQAVMLGRLGILASQQQNYAEARLHHSKALDLFRALREPAGEAVNWYELGMVAQALEEWTEAERCYRESLMIDERLGNEEGAVMTYNQLALVAQGTGRPSEAEGWYKRTLEFNERVQPKTRSHARTLHNLAHLLTMEEQAGRSPKARLAEAWSYAEQALTILETLDASSEIWKTLGILADLAELKGQVEVAQNYRRRDREAFAAFEGNRYYIDQRFGPLIAAIAAARSNIQVRAKVETFLFFAERDAEGRKHFAAATRGIWAGERDWQVLVEDLNRQEAFLILRVLEIIAGE